MQGRQPGLAVAGEPEGLAMLSYEGELHVVAPD